MAYRARPPAGERGQIVYDLRRHFVVTPEEVRARFGAYLDRFPVRIEVCVDRRQVDELIRHPAGTELLSPSTTTRPTPSSTTSYRSGGCDRRLPGADRCGRIIVNTGMGFEAPHHKRVFDAIRPGPTHYIITTQGHVDHVGGVDLFREAAPPTSPRPNNQLCQADDARIRALRMRTAGIWFDTLGTDAVRIAERKPRRVDAPGRTGARHHLRPAARASTSTASGWNCMQPWGRRSTVRRVAARAAAQR